MGAITDFLNNGGSGVIDSLISAGVQFGSQALQNKYDMQMAENMNQYYIDMWNRQNEYNSPQATMQRLVDAGINPRAYQQIGQFANAGTPQPSAPMHKASEVSALQNLAQFQTVARQALENKKLSEEIETMRTNRGLLESKTVLSQLMYVLKGLNGGIDPIDFAGELGLPDYKVLGEGGIRRPGYYYSPLAYHTRIMPEESEWYRKITEHRLLSNLRSGQVDLNAINKELQRVIRDDYTQWGIKGTGWLSDSARGAKRLLDKIINSL